MIFSDYLRHLHSDAELRDFLHKLYSLGEGVPKKKRERLLKTASSEQLNFVIQTLHWIMRHEIHISAEHSKKIIKSCAGPLLLNHFGPLIAVKGLQRETKEKRIAILARVTCYHNLLWAMFNKKPNK